MQALNKKKQQKKAGPLLTAVVGRPDLEESDPSRRMTLPYAIADAPVAATLTLPVVPRRRKAAGVWSNHPISVMTMDGNLTHTITIPLYSREAAQSFHHAEID